jgi:MFS transporter, NNP family, nitrate/nitrite transporter
MRARPVVISSDAVTQVIFVGPAELLHTGGPFPHHSGSAAVRETERKNIRSATPGKRRVATVIAMAAPPQFTQTPMAQNTVTAPPQPPSGRSGRWIDDWRPEDPQFWDSTGKNVARRNLFFSIFSEHIGFSIWSLWSVLVLFLPEAVFGIDPAGKFLLTTLPTALGAFVRLPYTFAVAKFGGRNWTVISAALLLIPTVAIAIVLKPGVSFTTLLVLSSLAGVGGGNFASSMANINAFYPDRLKGWALGLNAGGGNLGVPVVQLVGLLVLATVGVEHPRVILVVYIPLIVVAAVGAALVMDNLTTARNQPRAMREATREPHTWIMSFLYIGTFGSFIGFGFAFGQVLQNQFTSSFATPLAAASLTWLGPLLGSLIRPVGGSLADRFGGARITFWNFVAMALGAGIVWTASQLKSLPLFVVGFVLLFVLSGIGNGSTYKMIPAIFQSQAQQAVAAGGDTREADGRALRMSGALIGIAGAIGAFGGVLVNLAFRQSFMTTGTGDSAYLVFIAFYLVCVAVTWTVYLRPKALHGMV